MRKSVNLKRNGNDYNWKDCLDKPYNILNSRQSCTFLYDIPSTIKDDGHADKKSHSHNIFPTSDSKFPGKA